MEIDTFPLGGKIYKYYTPIENMEKNTILKYLIDKKENIKTSKVFSRTTAFKFREFCKIL